jgi:hypothetical protein
MMHERACSGFVRWGTALFLVIASGCGEGGDGTGTSAGTGPAIATVKGSLRVDAALADAHRAFRAHRASGESGPFRPRDPTIRMIGERVLIDATASDSSSLLLAELEGLGLVNGAVAGPVVSGELPIDAVPALDGLASLRFARAARPSTGGDSLP